MSDKDRRAVAAELKGIYRAKDADAGKAALEAFGTGDLRGLLAASLSGIGSKASWPSMGQEISRHRHVLATPLAGGDPVLRVP